MWDFIVAVSSKVIFIEIFKIYGYIKIKRIKLSWLFSSLSDLLVHTYTPKTDNL